MKINLKIKEYFIILIILILFHFNTKSFAINCAEIFANSYNDPTCYQFGSCYKNILNILEKLRQNRIPLKNAYVIFVLYEEIQTGGINGPIMESSVYVNRLKDHKLPHPISFKFHVFLEYEGKILDLDFSPRMEDPSYYLYEMYYRGSVKDIFKKIKLIRIPARAYIYIYDKLFELMQKFLKNKDPQIMEKGSNLHLTYFIRYFTQRAPNKIFPIMSMEDYKSMFSANNKEANTNPNN